MARINFITATLSDKSIFSSSAASAKSRSSARNGRTVFRGIGWRSYRFPCTRTRATCLEHNIVSRKVVKNHQRSNALLNRFPFRQRGCHRRPGLSDLITLASNILRYYSTVVLVTPDHEVDRVVEHALGNGVIGAVLHATRTARDGNAY